MKYFIKIYFRKYLFLFFFILISIFSYCQVDDTKKYLQIWPSLKTLSFNINKINQRTILYNKKYVTINENFSLKTVKQDSEILKFQLNNSDNIYSIDYKKSGTQPFIDSFVINQILNNGIKKRITHGNVICIPGSNFIYIEKPLMNNGLTSYNITEKWHEKSKKLIQIKQQFYYIGIQTVANCGFYIYERIESSKVIAYIQKESIITVVGVSSVLGIDYDWYLIKSVTNLIGWHKAKHIETKRGDTKSYFSISILDGYYP